MGRFTGESNVSRETASWLVERSGQGASVTGAGPDGVPDESLIRVIRVVE